MDSEWAAIVAVCAVLILQAIRIDHLNRLVKIQQRFLESLADYHSGESDEDEVPSPPRSSNGV